MKTISATTAWGEISNRVLTGKEREEAFERAKQLPTIMVDFEAVITIEMIATGVLSPNEGFMNEEDYKSVLTEGRLLMAPVWPVPLSFAPIGDSNKQVIQSLSVGDEVALVDETKEPVAILKLEDIFEYDREFRAKHLFGTTTAITQVLMPFIGGWGIRLWLDQFNCCAGYIGVHLNRYAWNQRIHGNYFMRRKNLKR